MSTHDAKYEQVMEWITMVPKVDDEKKKEQLISAIKAETRGWKNSKSPHRKHLFMKLNQMSPENGRMGTNMSRNTMVIPVGLVHIIPALYTSMSRGNNVLSDTNVVMKHIMDSNQDFMIDVVESLTYEPMSDSFVHEISNGCCAAHWQTSMSHLIFTIQQLHFKVLQRVVVEYGSTWKDGIPLFIQQSRNGLIKSIMDLNAILSSGKRRNKAFWTKLFVQQMIFLTSFYNELAFSKIALQ